jgi:uncharacterized protein YpmB
MKNSLKKIMLIIVIIIGILLVLFIAERQFFNKNINKVQQAEVLPLQ